MTFKISVIIPIFNASDDMNVAIESVLNQSIGFDNIELILVDDASTDSSKKIIKKYQSKYNNVKGIFCEKNSGFPGKPRNIGIEHATADYIIFLDSDDLYLEDAFKILYNTIVKENSDFVIASNYINLDGNKVKANIINSNKKLVNINLFDSQKSFDIMSSNFLIGPWGKIFKKEVLINNNVQFLENSLCEDTYFYFKLLLSSSKVSILPQDVVYVYNTYENKETAIHGHNLKKFNDFLKGLYEVTKLLDSINFSKEIFLSDNIGSLLLIFINLDKKYKFDACLKIYEFEQTIKFKKLNLSKEVDILNKTILKKHFKLAIFISIFYRCLYNNKTIKNLYRRFNNKKRGLKDEI